MADHDTRYTTYEFDPNPLISDTHISINGFSKYSSKIKNGKKKLDTFSKDVLPNTFFYLVLQILIRIVKLTAEHDTPYNIQYTENGKPFIPAIILSNTSKRLQNFINKVHSYIMMVNNFFDSNDQKELCCSCIRIIFNVLSKIAEYYDKIYQNFAHDFYSSQYNFLMETEKDNYKKVIVYLNQTLVEDPKFKEMKVIYYAIMFSNSLNIGHILFHEPSYDVFKNWIYILRFAIRHIGCI
jgi:hypothetical protein